MDRNCLYRTGIRPIRAIDAYSVPKAFDKDLLHLADWRYVFKDVQRLEGLHAHRVSNTQRSSFIPRLGVHRIEFADVQCLDKTL
jgi:hypothetical protein